MFNKLIDELEERIKKHLDTAYNKGYESGTADAERRMQKIYEYGWKAGHSDTLAALGEVDIEEIDEALDPSVFEEVARCES